MLHFITDILSTPAILIGLVALLGLAIQKNQALTLLKVQLKQF